MCSSSQKPLISNAADKRPQKTLFIVCSGNELFYIGLYLMKWVHTPLTVSLGWSLPYGGHLTWA